MSGFNPTEMMSQRRVNEFDEVVRRVLIEKRRREKRKDTIILIALSFIFICLTSMTIFIWYLKHI